MCSCEFLVCVVRVSAGLLRFVGCVFVGWLLVGSVVVFHVRLVVGSFGCLFDCFSFVRLLVCVVLFCRVSVVWFDCGLCLFVCLCA